MSCSDNVCGTGGWNGPKPGDPDNNVALSANTVYGGIDVSWTYPATNPAAVAHTILYRGLNSDFSQAVERAIVAGSIFYDKPAVTQTTEYFYWIRIVSSNGTVMDPVGPVSAEARVLGEQTLESLTNRIDNGVLAQALKTSIAGIPLLDAKIIDEVNKRIDSNAQLAQTLDALNTQLQGTQALLQQEVVQRTDADGSIVSIINDMRASVDGQGALIHEEQTVRATQHDALAQTVQNMGAQVADNTAVLTELKNAGGSDTSAWANDIQILYAKTADNKSAIDTEKTVRSNADSANADLITALTARVGTAETAIQTEQTTRADAVSAQAKSVTDLASRLDGDIANIRTTQDVLVQNGSATSYLLTQLTSKVNDNSGAIQNEITARADAVSSLTNQIAASESRVNGNVATVQTQMQTKIDTTNGKVNAIGALYTAKVQVNGLIGGFGVYNDGSSVEAGFDVDTFWVGRTYGDGTNAVKPFIVDQDTVYIDKARIRNADIDTLKLAGSAVTVPITASTNKTFYGTGKGNWKTIIKGYIKLDIAGIVYAHCITKQNYGQGIRYWAMRISVNGSMGQEVGGQSVADTPVVARSMACDAGVIPVIVEWWGEDSGVHIHNAELFIMGTKR